MTAASRGRVPRMPPFPSHDRIACRIASAARGLYRPSVKHLAALLLLPTAAFSQVVSQDVGDGLGACPLSESQTQKSIEAFAEIFPFLAHEPRCVNCHGAVNA